MEWISAKDEVPDDSRYVIGRSNASNRPFIIWHDGSQWVGLSNYTPQVSFWCDIPEFHADE